MSEAILPTHRCFSCKKEKPVSCFCKCSSRKSGLQNECKSCNLARSKQPHRVPQIRAAIARWNKTERAMKAHRGYARAYYSKIRGTDMQKARSKVTWAVQNGLLPKAKTLLCAHCGKKAAHYHHHQGYSLEHYLHVVPLCTFCHRKADNLRYPTAAEEV